MTSATMNHKSIATILFLSTLSVCNVAKAENFTDVRQLLSTKQCQNCDLSNAGLVMADLSGADLSGANLSNANLSRANLSGADLRGANLSGAGLFGVNLSGAKLAGANLFGADLRNSYLYNAELTGIDLNSMNLQGATGIPLQSATHEQFYAWGVTAAQKGNQEQAIEYFERAIAIKPDYAGAYLARGVARYQLLDSKGAFQDAQIAEKFFQTQNNTTGVKTAQAFLVELKTPQTTEIKPSKPSLMDFVGSLGSALLQFLPF